MSVVAIAPRRWKKPPLIKRAWLRWTIGLGVAVYLALALGTTEVNWVRVWEGLPRGARFFAAFFPPDFASRWTEIADGILESIWMTVVSTVIGIAISIPVGKMDLRFPMNPANDNPGSNVQYHLRASFRDHIPQAGGNRRGYCGAVNFDSKKPIGAAFSF